MLTRLLATLFLLLLIAPFGKLPDEPDYKRAPMVPPYLGCVSVRFQGEGKSLTWLAVMVGGAYDADHILGEFAQGALMPKPWDRWRLVEVAMHLDRVSPRPGHVVIRNEDSGETIKLWVESLPDRPTTRPGKPTHLWFLGSFVDERKGALRATLTAGTPNKWDKSIGAFQVGEMLPSPWNRWRLVEINTMEPLPAPIRDRSIVVRNQDTGRQVTLEVQAISGPPREKATLPGALTTLPLDNAAEKPPATQPVERKATK